MNKQFVLPTIFSAIDKFTSPVGKMTKSMKNFSNQAMSVARTSALVGAAVIAPLLLAGHEAVKFEDKMADIAKTTGLKGKELVQFGEDILTMSGTTRTSIEELQTIGEIGGQLGIAKGDLLGFVDAANQFNVALGKDFSGGTEQAVASVGKIKNIFKQTRGNNMSIVDAIMKTGSAINELGAAGAGTSENISEFALRLGALPDAIKPGLTQTLALGTYFEEMGLDARIASGGLANLLQGAAKELPKFAKQMGLTEVQAKNLLNTDPTEFAKKFSKTLKSLSGTDAQKVLRNLKLNDLEVLKVVGHLGGNTERLTELQYLSNKAFAEGSSLAIEYGVKNETMAGKIKRAENNFRALGIVIGTELLPLIGDLLKEVVPVVKSFVSWVKENKGLVLVLAKVAIGISALSFAISAISTAVAFVTTIMRAYVFVQWLVNAAMLACPALWVVAAFILLIAVIALLSYGMYKMIENWDKWGASMNATLGPLGFVIALVQSFRKQWDNIINSFKSGGFLGGIKAIGAALLDIVLQPLQQILRLIADITGFDWAKSAADGVKNFRHDIGVTGTGALDATPLTTAEQEHQDQVAKTMTEAINSDNSKLSVEINNKTGNEVKAKSNNDRIPIRLSTTHAWGQ